MREYKMRRGEELSERIPDLQATVEEYFGKVTGTETYKDSELYVIGEPDNPVFERVVVGAVSYAGKKDRLAVDFNEREARTLIEMDALDAAEEAVSIKNEFLLEATGRNAKSRRESMKREIEEDTDVPDA